MDKLVVGTAADDTVCLIAAVTTDLVVEAVLDASALEEILALENGGKSDG